MLLNQKFSSIVDANNYSKYFKAFKYDKHLIISMILFKV